MSDDTNNGPDSSEPLSGTSEPIVDSDLPTKPTGRVIKDRSPFIDKSGRPFNPSAVLGLSQMYGWESKHDLSTTGTPWNPELFRHPLLEAPVPGGTHELLLGGSKITLASGAGCVLGKPNKGKTLLSNTLIRRNPDYVDLIRFREPEDDALTSERALVNRMLGFFASDKKVCFVDSVRTIFYRSGGATGKGGVNMGLFEILTEYDILARHAGKVILFALNPMTNDDAQVDFYLDAVIGSVTHAVHANDPLRFRINSRQGRDRHWADYRYIPVDEPTPAQQGLNGLSTTVQTKAADSILDLYLDPTN